MYSFRTNGNYIDFVNTDATSLAVETVVKSLHNTSRCVDWSLPEDTTRISFTIDEDKYNNLLITDIDFDGVAMDSQDDFETGITAMFTGLAGGSPGGSSYLVYIARLRQNATATVDVDAVLENTFGGELVWTNGGADGYFIGTLNGRFPDREKVWFSAASYVNGQTIILFDWNDVNSVAFEVKKDGLLTNDVVPNLYIEIRLYP